MILVIVSRFQFPDIDVLWPSTSDDSIWTSWKNPYPDCAEAECEYQLYSESDGVLVRSGVTINNGFRLSGFPCGTRYRLHISYRTNTKTVKETWFSVRTTLLCK